MNGYIYTHIYAHTTPPPRWKDGWNPSPPPPPLTPNNSLIPYHPSIVISSIMAGFGTHFTRGFEGSLDAIDKKTGIWVEFEKKRRHVPTHTIFKWHEMEGIEFPRISENFDGRVLKKKGHICNSTAKNNPSAARPLIKVSRGNLFVISCFFC